MHGPRPRPHRTASDIEARVCRLRTDRKVGPARISPILRLPASTVHRTRTLTRHRLNRLDWATGTVIRRPRGRALPRLRHRPDRAGADGQCLGLRQRPGLEGRPSDLDTTGKLTRAYRPQTNGKVERFNRTHLDEWASLRPFTWNDERTAALADLLHTHNHHRRHTALDGHAPFSRANNPAGRYT